MNLNKMCQGCFREKPDTGPCPYCGFDESRYESDRPPELLPSGVILQGKYIVGRCLGKGGFGITYLGWHITLQKRVAIKEMYPKGIVFRDTRGEFDPNSLSVRITDSSLKSSYEKASESFLKEARTLAKIHLPGVISIHDCFEENGTAYLVMDYIPGDSLRTYLKGHGGKISEEETLTILHPVMKSLKELHQKNIIHRDISPDNLLLDEKGNVVLIDFGAARSIDFQNGNGTSLSVILKPGYAPIEQYDSQGKQGPWTDVYAMCATMYRMLTGESPKDPFVRMQDNQDMDIIVQVMRSAGVSEKTIKAIRKGMAVLQGNRFQSMSELEKALYEQEKSNDDVKRTLEVQSQRETIPPERNTESGRKSFPWYLMSIPVFVAVGGILFYLNRAHIDEPVTETDLVEVDRNQNEEFIGESSEAALEIPVLKSGSEVNKLLKELAGTNAESVWDDDENIKTIIFSQESAPASTSTVDLMDSGPAVTAWFDNGRGTIYIHTDADRVMMNEHASCIFYGMKSLKNVDLSKFDTSNVTYMYGLFYNCSALESLDLSSFDTSVVTYMSYMFYDCSALESLDLSSFDTSVVTDMSYMFECCSALESLDLSSFDTSVVTAMRNMFSGCSALESLDLSSFDTSNVTDMTLMFYLCDSLTNLVTYDSRIREAYENR